MNDPGTVEVNDLLQVRLVDDPDAHTYRSRVEDVSSDGIHISWPSHRGKLMRPALGCSISISFVRDDAAYIFVGVVEERALEPIPYLRVRPLGLPERMQRRKFVRIKTSIPVELRGALRIGPDKSLRDMSLKATTYDLSGGGLCVRSHAEPSAGAVLDARLFLPDGLLPIRVRVTVITCQPIVTRNQKQLNRIGLCFLAISEADRTRIVRYLTKIQAQQLETE
jgi:c-di-GMP-binding flagellar brake protein YcgR